MSAVDAVTLGSSGMVAHSSLHHARFAPGESVLVRGAAGGIVIIDVVAARTRRRSSPSSTRTAAWWPSARSVVPRPADFVMEMIAAFRKSMSFATSSADTVSQSHRRAVTADLFAAAGRGELEAVVQGVLPLAEAVSAHRKMEVGEVAFCAGDTGIEAVTSSV